MAKSIIQFKCLLMSPGDVSNEREAATEVIQRWNAQIGDALGATVDLVKWETHSQPEMGMHPQKILNQQMVEDADFGIGIFWSKLGTPTDTHASGTVEEIEGLRNKGAKVSLYLSQQPIPQNMQEEYRRLSDYIESLKHSGLLQYYPSVHEFRELFLLHLTKTVVDLIFKEKGVESIEGKTSSEQQKINTLEKPNIQIKTTGALVPDAHGSTKWFLAVSVQNHSTNTVFLGSTLVQLTNGQRIFYQRDAITSQPNSRQELKSGQSFSFHIDPNQLAEDIEKLELLDQIVVTDDIDRVYSSADKNLPDTVASLISL
ncbi:hypothetical protein MOS06_004598 [Vibrio parahaemolyticus]|nr:hypothetical protein [Vibrio parahaemolyticus]